MAAALPTEALQSIILNALDAAPITDTRSLPIGATPAGPAAEDQLAIKGALDSLAARDMVTYEAKNVDLNELTAEGATIAQNGSHEYLVWAALSTDEPKSVKQIGEAVGADVAKIGQGRAMKNKWIAKKGDGFVKATEAVVDTTKIDLEEVRSTGNLKDEKLLADYRKRKLVEKKKVFYYSVVKGSNFSTTIQKLETDLTVELLASGEWEKASFKKYNFEAEGVPPAAGALHPLMKVREEFRHIFFEMGFTEMPTNRYVESSFWNFDALFVPQQHPAREMQDTFYLKDPVSSNKYPADYAERVKTVHQTGGYGSTGYRYPFSDEETQRLVLRTHTTSVSTAMLYELANQPGGFKPAKLFSIDRVFRNEAVDATHLAEFHQVEGVVADYNLTLADLIGFMEVFFAKMGVTNLRFKPAYNPYTEPSLEIFSWHQGLGKWVEIGNSGMFRPEMLETMGLPPDVRVHGWGLSLERPTMIRYGISNIRDLLGHKVPLDMVERSAASMSTKTLCSRPSTLAGLTPLRPSFNLHSAVKNASTTSAPPPKPKGRARRVLPIIGFAGIGLSLAGWWALKEDERLTPFKFTPLKIKRIERLTPETSIFTLEVPPEMLPLPDGASDLAIKSLYAMQPDVQIQRPYTPLDSAGFDASGNGEIDLLVKRYENGELSRWMHYLKVGDQVRVRGPETTWNIPENTYDEIVFIVGGTGMTPAYQTIKKLERLTNPPKISVIYSSPTPSTILLKSSLDAFAAKDPAKVTIQYLVDNLDPGTKKNPIPGMVVGRVQLKLLKQWIGMGGATPRRLVVVCGPEA
ncbi:phenylalanyl-tRNA synthetase alpha chain [Pseudohyphozyma bogoriensis]|nr:phenylalanyl-tRNA synthetase alpha chain [Pseudohyphozyma bogoriensis]